MDLQGIANFSDDLIGGLLAISLSLVFGSLAWRAWILREVEEAAPRAATTRCIDLLIAGACGVGLCQLMKLGTKIVLLQSMLGAVPWSAYTATTQFQAGLVRCLLGLTLAFSAYALRVRPADALRWNLTAAVAAALWICGAWLVHAVGRFEWRSPLMALTILHQLAAAVWVGCVIQLLTLRHMRKKDASLTAFWPVALTRFTPLGIGCVAVLLTSGTILVWEYVGSPRGLVGTGYGSLVVIKLLLLAMALGFAFLNMRAGRAWRSRGYPAVANRVPYYVEAESFLLIATLFVAATVSSQPPAVDIPTLTARPSEVAAMFSPKLPRLASPTHEALLAGESGRLAIIGRVPSVAAAEWSDYNHNIAGLFLLAMGALALFSYHRGFSAARYWPIGFMLLAAFLFVRSDAESWPLGPLGFWVSTFGMAKSCSIVSPHCSLSRSARLRSSRGPPKATPQARYIFPVLVAVGGILLITHAHAAFERKEDFLIQSTHVVMGLLAMIMAVTRWLELRLAPLDSAQSRAAGILSVTAMLLVGVILMFYREPY